RKLTKLCCFPLNLSGKQQSLVSFLWLTLHHEGRVCRCCHTPCSKVNHRKLTKLCCFPDKFNGCFNPSCEFPDLPFLLVPYLPDLTHHYPHVPYGFNDVTCPWFALGPYHGSPLIYPPECLAEVPCTADKWNGKFFLINVKAFIRRGYNLTLVYHVTTECRQDLGLN